MARKLKTFPVVVCTDSNTPYKIYPTTLFVLTVTIFANAANTGNIYVGDDAVTTTTGVPVAPGDTCEIDVEIGGKTSDEISVDDIYIISGTSGNSARVIAMVRKP